MAGEREQQIAAWLHDLTPAEGCVVELRALGLPSARAKSAFFRLPDAALAMAVQALTWEASGGRGVYWTMNPVRQDVTGKSAAHDSDIIARRWLLLDIDPVRPADTCSTGGEKAAAWQVACDAAGGLEVLGWGRPVIADSGNGYHLLYPVDLPNDEQAKTQVQTALQELNRRMGTDSVKVDTSVFNASRIVRLWGTLTRKGENTEERPWRTSAVLEIPEEINREATTAGVLRTLARWAAAEGMRASSPPARANGDDSAHADSGHAVGDDFDRRADWADILEPHGWTRVGEQAGKTLWRRPGKTEGHSATTGHCHGEDGGDLLYVFTDSSSFKPNKGYGKFRAYCLLNHGGNHSDAAKELASRGYGGPARPKKKPPGKGKPDEEKDDEPAEKLPETIDDVARVSDLVRAGAEIEWLWPRWIARRVVTLIAADGGVGKTRFAMDLMRRSHAGLPWPDGQPMATGHNNRWLWILADDNHAEAADMVQKWGMDDAFYLPATKADPFAGTQLDGNHERLRHYLRVVRPAFLVVDTLGSATSLKMHSQEECEILMRPLRKMANEFNMAVLCLTHLNASGGVLGRRAVEKARQAIMLSEPDPDQPNRRRLWVSKSNAQKPKPLGMTHGEHGCEYDDSPPCEPGSEPGMGPRKPGRPDDKLQAAMDDLAAYLEDGPKSYGNTKNAMELKGHSMDTVKRAFKALGCHSTYPQRPVLWSLAAIEEEF